MNKSSWVILAALFASPAFAAELIKDVNAVPLVDNVSAGGFASAVQTNGGIVFFSEDLAHGLEPWVTDGTPAGTRLLKDINPGPVSCGVEMITAMNGLVFFLADDGTNGFELWRTDGTANGTSMVANIGPGAANGAGAVIVGGGKYPVINNVLYFGGNDGVSGDELWRTDGTASGTYRLSDGAPGSAGLTPSDFRVVGTRLYFRADAGVSAQALWTSDGTAAGTRNVGVEQVAGTTMGSFWVAGDTMFFQLTNAASGTELWRATTSGTASLVADLRAGPGDSDPVPIAVMSDFSLLFTAFATTGVVDRRLMRVRGNEAPSTILDPMPSDIGGAIVAPHGVLINFPNLPLFLTDGTANGSGFVNSELRFSSGAGQVVSSDGYVYFFGSTGFGSDIWRTDGTFASLTQYTTLDMQVASEQLALSNGKFYFMQGRFTDTEHGSELWTSDGTPAGTKLFKEFTPGPDSSSVGIYTLGNRLLLDVFDGQSAIEPWVSDGTEANTIRLADLTVRTATGSSEPEVLGNVGARTIFRADDGIHGFEIWATDGTSAGTRILTNQPDGTNFSGAASGIALSSIMLFVADGSAGPELWRTDGTPGGTSLVKDITPGPAGSEIRLYDGIVLNDVAYFIANDGAHGPELWRSDGTNAGTWLVNDLTPGNEDRTRLLSSTANDRLFVYINNAPPKLYSTDGTAAGTQLVSDTLAIDYQHDFVFQNRVCFAVGVANDSSEVYCSAGAAGDAVRITDFHSVGVDPQGEIVVLNGHLLASCHDWNGVGKSGLYIGDGTPAGFTKISNEKVDDGVKGVMLSGGTRFAFFKQDSTASGLKDIWVTDGTAGGTRSMLAGSSVVRANILDGLLVGLNDSVIFDVIDTVKGPVVWRSDGTVAGTRFLFDVDPASDNADRPPVQFVRNGSRIYFSAMNANVGNELWSFNTTNPNATEDEATTAFNTAATINVAANDSDFDSPLTAPTIEIVTQPASGTVVANTGAGSVTYTPNNGFSGLDTFVYRVIDLAGNPSIGASVNVTVRAAPSSTAPGTPPSPPSNPPPSGGGGGGNSSGGGGGAFGFELLLLGLLVTDNARRCRRRAISHRPS